MRLLSDAAEGGPDRRLIALLVLTVGAFVASTITPAPRASACAIAWSAAGSPPRIDAEQALIVWDAEHHTEHFLRQADFGSANVEFGFLVPTPSRPTLGEANPRLFQRLAPIYSRPPPRPNSTTMGARSAGGGDTPVMVVETRRVAGLDATVLLARDASALASWLGDHGFSGRPALSTWLAPYVARGFYVTAFRFVPGADRRALGAPVRLSFATDAPFYPYAEPTGASASGQRRFVLSVVGDARMSGRLGSAPWSARTAYAGQSARLRQAIADSLPSGTTIGSWMTTFEETNSVRGADDLTFVRSTETSTVAPSVHATYRARPVRMIDPFAL